MKNYYIERALIRFKSAFASASGIVKEKEAVFIKHGDDRIFECAWSPSLGVSPKNMYSYFRGAEVDNNVVSYIESQLEWAALLHLLPEQQCANNNALKVIEYGLDAHPSFDRIDQDLILRLKCKEKIPSIIMRSHNLSKGIWLDFNGSGDYITINSQLDDLTKRYKGIIYIEQPFLDTFEIFQHNRVVRVYDTSNYHFLLNNNLINSNSIAILKPGRNNYNEFQALNASGIKIQFNTVLSSQVYRDFIDALNMKFSTFISDVISQNDVSTKNLIYKEEICSQEIYPI